MNIIMSSTPNKWKGGNACQVIVIHWWDDPAKKPTIQGVVSAFKNPDYQVSAHYVVSGDDVVKMCEETDRAWHAIAANGFGIGIEVDPNTPGNTYKTLGELVKGIRARHGNIPLKKHSDYVNTRCPGSIDLARIDKEANKGEDMASTVGEVELNMLSLGFFGYPASEEFLKAHKGQETNSFVRWCAANSAFVDRETMTNNLAVQVNELKQQVAAGGGDPKAAALLKAIREAVK